MKNPDDPQGRTYRQVNAAKKYAVPLGTCQARPGARVFVVKQRLTLEPPLPHDHRQKSRPDWVLCLDGRPIAVVPNRTDVEALEEVLRGRTAKS